MLTVAARREEEEEEVVEVEETGDGRLPSSL